jgi:hypothetical protein
VSGAVSTQHCYACGSEWELNGETEIYEVCGECGHLWFTGKELEDHDYDTQVELAQHADGLGRDAPIARRLAHEIKACPCCAHDI